ncbi:MAG TPA: zinc ribbon domain-containing protein [Capsulimonadaceae bacterium]
METRSALNIAAAVGRATILIGSITVAAGTVQPWGKFVALHSWHVNVPGVAFVTGLTVLALASATLLYRKYSAIAILVALVILATTYRAQSEVPIAIRGQLLSLQVALVPINRLMDQFHLPNVDAGNYGDQRETFLGEGLSTSRSGAWLILLGALLAMPRDVTFTAIRRRYGMARCNHCAASWAVSRDAEYCPKCGASQSGTRTCPHCRAVWKDGDVYCVGCGAKVPAIPTAPLNG